MHSLQFYFHELKGNLTEICCRLSSFLALAVKDRGQVAPRTVYIRPVPFLEVCWCQGWHGMGGQTLSWSFLCTPNSSGLSGYHQDSVLGKATLRIHRVNLLLGIHAYGFLRQNAEHFFKFYKNSLFLPVCVCACAHVCVCVYIHLHKCSASL